jgi:hypothetical protein
MLFIKRKESLLRVGIDNGKHNQGTIMDQYPVPLIAEMLARLSKVKYISQISICDTYSLIKVHDKDVWKSAIHTHYGLFESLVMPFELINVFAIFQQYVNNTLCPYLEVFCMAYLDQVVI